jgi:hypothetical protein
MTGMEDVFFTIVLSADCVRPAFAWLLRCGVRMGPNHHTLGSAGIDTAPLPGRRGWPIVARATGKASPGARYEP